jgi:sigma-B regulation protein RsbU (phosphoserine phosphatase)
MTFVFRSRSGGPGGEGSDAASAASLATRVIRKLPPPREVADSTRFAERAVAEILSAFRRDRGGLWLWSGNGGVLELAAARGEGLPGSLTPSPAAHRGEAHGTDLLAGAEWQALAVAGIVETHPLLLPGRLIGLLGVGCRRGGLSDSNEAELELETVASYLAGLLGGDLLTRRIKETDFELRYRLWELESLYDIGLSIARSLEVESLAEEILLRGISLIGARRGSIDLQLADDDEPFHLDFGGRFLDPERIREIASGEAVLTGSTEEVAEGLPPHLAVPIRTDTRRIGVLAFAEKESRGGGIRAFETTDLRTMTLLAAQAAIALENARLHRAALEKERMEREIEVAASIQREILPKEAPEIDGLAVWGRTRPKRGVGGDYYDWLPLPGGRLVVVLADVSGKGIPASLLVSTLSTGLHLVVDDPFDPVAAVERLDRHLLRLAATRKYATMALVLVDPASDRLLYISAGHNPALLLSASGGWQELPATGIPLGMLEGPARTVREIPFRPGDRLCLYSDGFTEAADAAGEEFGLEALVARLVGSPESDDTEIGNLLFDDVARFAKGVEQYDDQTLVLLRRTERVSSKSANPEAGGS